MEIAGGWLGWSEYDSLHADVNFILVSHKGLMDRLTLCFGLRKITPLNPVPVEEVSKPLGSTPKNLTPDLFDAFLEGTLDG